MTLRFPLLLLTLCAFSLGAFAQPSPPVPIDEVVFFKSGVSYVEHRGQVQGSETMTLRFEREQMKDVLKSLVLQDEGGGRVGTILYPSRNPPWEALESYPLSEDPEDFGTLMNQMRGADLRLNTPNGTVAGTAVSAERRDGPNDAEQWYLNLYGDGTLRSVALDSVRTLRFEDPELRGQMRRGLEAAAAARDGESRPVRLRFDGTGSRRVRAGYVVKTPVWRRKSRIFGTAFPRWRTRRWISRTASTATYRISTCGEHLKIR